MTGSRPSLGIKLAVGLLVVGLAVPFVIRTIQNLAVTRRAVAVYARLIAGANAQDLPAVRSLCAARYLQAHPIERSKNGGLVGFPRQIHPNYQVWRQGGEVWLCQGNRVGVVVRFVPEGEVWKYAGVVGILRSDGRIASANDLDETR